MGRSLLIGLFELDHCQRCHSAGWRPFPGSGTNSITTRGHLCMLHLLTHQPIATPLHATLHMCSSNNNNTPKTNQKKKNLTAILLIILQKAKDNLECLKFQLTPAEVELLDGAALSRSVFLFRLYIAAVTAECCDSGVCMFGLAEKELCGFLQIYDKQEHTRQATLATCCLHSHHFPADADIQNHFIHVLLSINPALI